MALNLGEFNEPDVNDALAQIAFRETVSKIEQMRHISSPILKVIYLQRVMDELMGVDPESMECAEADKLIFLIFYVICSLRSQENPNLGARFIEECFYVDQFMHEEQLGLIQQYTNISHLKTCLHYLEKGIASCEKNFINVDPEKENSSSEEELPKPASKFHLEDLLKEKLGDKQNFDSKKTLSHLSLQPENRSEGFKIFEKFRQENMLSKSLVNS